ncbi:MULTISPECIES: hypothetical protein [Aeromonas]|nr:hypothetical protein [Aeromonas hydrophila]
MKRNNIYSSLRNSSSESAANFYQNLAEKTLKSVGLMTSYDLEKKVTIYDVKVRMGINYNALAKIVSLLESQNYVLLTIGNSSEPSLEVSPNDLFVSLTKEGLNAILKDTK